MSVLPGMADKMIDVTRRELASSGPRARIVLSINSAWNIANFRAGLIRRLREEGHEVICLAPEDGYVPRLKEMGCRFLALSMDKMGTSPLNDAALFLRFLRVFVRERPDVLLGYTIKPNIYGSLAAHALGIPTINNVSGLGTAFIRDNWLTRLVRLLYRAALRHAYCVFFQNADDHATFVDRGIVKQEIARILPGSGIDLGRFEPMPLPTRKNNQETRFLLIARLLYDKGVGEFVEAARILKQQNPDLQFALLGFLDIENRTAVPRAEVDRWVTEGLVEYLGAVDDVRPYVTATDCIVLPSYREGTPRTLLEGAAMARPLITTDVPGCREVVEHGVNGYLCKPRSARDLADKMVAFTGLPPTERAAMGKAGRQKMERQFNEQIVIDAYIVMIHECLETRVLRKRN